MPFTSNLDADMARALAAVDAGLRAGGYYLANRIKEQLAGGYTSGDFVTGHVLNSVTLSEPYDEGNARVLEVGTDVDYALFWEMGFDSIFSRHYERVEIWRPTMEQEADTVGAIVDQTIQSLMNR